MTPVKVILPKWIWTDATNNDEFKANLSKYMNKNYPGYAIDKVEKHYALCQRG